MHTHTHARARTHTHTHTLSRVPKRVTHLAVRKHVTAHVCSFANINSLQHETNVTTCRYATVYPDIQAKLNTMETMFMEQVAKSDADVHVALTSGVYASCVLACTHVVVRLGTRTCLCL
jgi:hypothetical protein